MQAPVSPVVSVAITAKVAADARSTPAIPVWASVVKVQVNAAASALPARSFTSVVSVAVKSELAGRFASGLNVASVPVGSSVTSPVTASGPGPATVNEAAPSVAGSIGSLNVALTDASIATAVAVSIGIVETTVGG